MSLREYHKKRDFTKTREPRGAEEKGRRSRLRFVIQKHAASHLHFDFRLELDGVMKSWAVPKGPSLDPTVRRLAMEVEDHPIEYNTFEGIIPKGQYGGGTVMLWDRGTYEADEQDPGEDDASALRRGYREGSLKFTMHGERLHGSFALVRMKGRSWSGSEKPQWLLIKHRDEFASEGADIVADEMTSVDTGRTMEEIGAGRGSRVWNSDRAGGDERGELKAPAKSGSRRAAATRKTAAKKAPAGQAAAKKTTAKKTTAKKATPRKRAARRSGPPPHNGPVAERLAEIEREGGDGTVSLGRGASIEVTSLDKVFWPDEGFTKGDLLRYYATVAPVILPVLLDRALVLKRYPDGIAGPFFFQQKPPEHPPRGMRIVEVTDVDGKRHERIVGGALVTLLYLAQIGVVSMDPWHSRVKSLDTPDYLALDLDPGPKATFPRIVEVARMVKAELDAMQLHGGLKTSGSRGIHIVVPLPPRTSYETSLLLARLIATRVAEAHPREATVERSLKERKPDAVYVDFLQNSLAKTLAAAWCVRPKPGAMVSMPLRWEELDDDLDPRDFTIATAPGRIAELGDIWAVAMKKRNTRAAIEAAATG